MLNILQNVVYNAPFLHFVGLFTVCIHILFAQNTFSSDSPMVLEKMVVTASRGPQNIGDLTRSVTIIDSTEIAQMSSQGVASIIAGASGVDMRRRGLYDIQSDLSIRGTTFEQTIILLDGFRLLDPQTGHHNLNLPIHTLDIATIEILRGHGSRIYGPNAMGGVVNIITKRPEAYSYSLTSNAGQFGLLSTSGSFSFPIGFSRNRLSVSKNISDGYRHNTDFDASTVFASTGFETNKVTADAIIGYNNKEFGANDFYAAGYPHQWEHTKTKFIGLKLGLVPWVGKINFKGSWRNNYDKYLLDKINPSFYQNKHRTNVLQAEAEYSIDGALGFSSVGIQGVFDQIESSNLGRHKRRWGGVFAEHSFLLWERLTIMPGVYAYYNPDFNFSLWPGMDLAYRFNSEFCAFATTGRSFRHPTFTDLYYTSPSNKGNANLKPEEALTAEVGARYNKKLVNMSAAVFGRRGSRLIDWVKMPGVSYYQAENLLNVDHGGVEVEATLFPPSLIKTLTVERLSASYSFIEANKHASDFESKYVLNHLRHNVSTSLMYRLGNIGHSWRLSYRQRVNQESYWLLDSRLSVMFKHINLYIDGNNILDTRYQEIGKVPMPGRWISVGASMAIVKP